MPIHKRKAASEQSTKRHNLRHPLLKAGSPALMLYRYIEQHPGCNSQDLRRLYPSGQAITDMLNEGLIERRGERRGHYKFYVLPGNSTGQGRDQVQVEVILFVNDYGEYSAGVSMVNQRLTAHEDNPREIMRQMVTLRPARPDEPYAARVVIDVNEPAHAEAPQPAEFVRSGMDLIIDTEYRHVDKS